MIIISVRVTNTYGVWYDQSYIAEEREEAIEYLERMNKSDSVDSYILLGVWHV